MSSALVVDCARLGAGAVDRIEVRREHVLEESTVTTARVLGGAVAVDVDVTAAGAAYVAVGRVEGTWTAECRRCLEEVRGSLCAPLREVFESDPAEGETWPINDERIDLGPPVRDAAVLSLPMAPLCSADCAGPEPDRFPTGPAAAGGAGSFDSSDAECPEPPGDPRWAALSQLRFDE